MELQQAILEISVIIPAYNAAKYLSATLDSLINQQYLTEILLVDDCSTDNTLEIMRHYAEKHPKIRIIFNDTNQGVSYSRNKAINEANSSWLLFMDADDVAHADLCEKLVNKLLHLQSDSPEQKWNLVYTAYQQIDQNGTVISGVVSGRQLMQKEAFGHLILRNLISTSGVLVNKQSALKVGGFPVQHRISEDWYLWLLLAQTSALGYVDEPLVMVRRHPSNTTNEVSKTHNPELEVLRSFDLEYIKRAVMTRRESEAQNLADYSAILQRLGHWSKARQLLESISDDNQTEAGWFYLSLGYILANQYTFAKVLLHRIIKINSENLSAINNLAVIYHKEGNSVLALKLLEKALSIQTNYLDAKINQALIISKKSDGNISFRWTDRILRTTLINYLN